VVGALRAWQDGPDVATADHSRPGVAAEGRRLVADALTSALLDLAEAVGPPEGEPAAATPSEPGREGGHVPGAGAARTLASLPSRAAADVASAIAASLVPAILERVDLNALLAKVDVNALVARLDIDSVLDSIDPDKLLARIDVDELIRRVDMGALAREALEGIDIGDLIQESTASIGVDTVEAARVQAMRADEFLARIVDRILMRRGPRRTRVPEDDE